MIATTTFIPNVDIVIGDRRVKSHPLSHPLCLVTHNMARYGKMSHHVKVQLFPVTGLLEPVRSPY
jgi:hypothetical protein